MLEQTDFSDIVQELLRGILRQGKSDVYVLAAAARRGFNLVLFTEPVSHGNTFVWGTCMPFYLKLDFTYQIKSTN